MLDKDQFFKARIYENYISVHNQYLNDLPNLKRFKHQFRVNDFYFKKFIPLNINANILDVGCGDGNFVYWLQQSGYSNVRGVDISKEQILAGKALGINGLYQNDLVSFLQTSAIKYDLIVARDVFEHFTRQDFFDALNLIKKSLTDGGKVLIQLPNGEGLNMTSLFYGDITHEMAYTRGSIRQLALAVGFSKVTVYPFSPFSSGIKGIIRTFLWNWHVMVARFWRFIERGHGDGIFTMNIIALLE